MRREWSTEDLIAAWTLIGDDWRLVGNKIEARFPRAADEFPSAAVSYVAEQVRINPADLPNHRWSGRTIEYNRRDVPTVSARLVEGLAVVTIDPLDWAALVTAAAVAGWVDAVVGGGGLIMLPVLLLVVPGASPQQALGTNKLTAIAGTGAAVATFARRVPMDWRLLAPAAALAAVAAGVGAAAVALIDRELFIPIIIVVLVGVAAFVTLRPQVGITMATHPPTRTKVLLVVLIAAGAIGFYDGLLGPGTGTFLIIVFATMLGTEFVRSAAMAKVINCGSNCGALAFFAATGNVLWAIGAVMACANIAGSVVGSRMALRKGSSFVRVVLLVVVVAMAIRLGWQQFG